MTPTQFKQANITLRPPADLDESQCMSIPAHVATVRGGTCDGATVYVVAWQPSPEELKDLNEGKPLLLSMLGGCPPHFPTTQFEQAIKPK